MTLALKARGIDLELFPPVVMSMIMGSLARMVLHEQGLGITRGHDQARAFIEQCLDRSKCPRGTKAACDADAPVTQPAPKSGGDQ